MDLFIAHEQTVSGVQADSSVVLLVKALFMTVELVRWVAELDQASQSRRGPWAEPRPPEAL